MYRPGHTGVWLLLYAPIGFYLLSTGNPLFALLGAGIVFIVEPIPDRDQRIPFLKHRGFSHTFGFALLVGLIIGAVGWFLGDEAFILAGQWLASSGFTGLGQQVVAARTAINAAQLGTFGFAMGVFAILAHLIGDVLTPMGIRPFWPLSDSSYSLSITTAKNPVANSVLLILGVLASAGAFWLWTTGG